MNTQNLIAHAIKDFRNSYIAQFTKEDKTTPDQKEAIRRVMYAQEAAFWVEVNLRTFEFENVRNFEQILGWSNESLSLQTFIQLIHPTYQLPYVLLANYINEFTIDFKDYDRIFEIAYHITVPLKHKNEKYYWFKQHTRALAIDEQNLVTVNFAAYTFDGEWNHFDRRLFQAFVTDNGFNAEEITNILTTRIHKYFLTHLTPHEIRLLGHYSANCSIEKVCQYYGRSRDYIREINAKILKKTQVFTGTSFINTVEIAQYLHEKGLIIEIPLA